MGRRAIEFLTTFLLLDLLYYGTALEEADSEWYHQKNSLRGKLTGDGRRKLESLMSRWEMMTPMAISQTDPSTSIPLASTKITTNHYPTQAAGNPATSSGQKWCVASQTAIPTGLQVALDYACGYGGADCSAIQPGRTCYNPDSLKDHASYAFNSYYQKNPIPTSCVFGGNAILTNIDPSTGSCKYPSTSVSNQSGSRVSESAPNDSGVLALQPASILACVLAFKLVAVFGIVLL